MIAFGIICSFFIAGGRVYPHRRAREHTYLREKSLAGLECRAVGRPQAQTTEGILRFKQEYSKSVGAYIVKPIKTHERLVIPQGVDCWHLRPLFKRFLTLFFEPFYCIPLQCPLHFSDELLIYIILLCIWWW